MNAMSTADTITYIAGGSTADVPTHPEDWVSIWNRQLVEIVRRELESKSWSVNKIGRLAWALGIRIEFSEAGFLRKEKEPGK